MRKTPEMARALTEMETVINRLHDLAERWNRPDIIRSVSVFDVAEALTDGHHTTGIHRVIAVDVDLVRAHRIVDLCPGSHVFAQPTLAELLGRRPVSDLPADELAELMRMTLPKSRHRRTSQNQNPLEELRELLEQNPQFEVPKYDVVENLLHDWQPGMKERVRVIGSGYTLPEACDVASYHPTSRVCAAGVITPTR